MEVESNTLIWKGVIQLVTCAAHADALNMGGQVKGGRGEKKYQRMIGWIVHIYGSCSRSISKSPTRAGIGRHAQRHHATMTNDILPLHDWSGYIPVSRRALLESFPLVWLIGSRFYCPSCVNVT